MVIFIHMHSPSLFLLLYHISISYIHTHTGCLPAALGGGSDDEYELNIDTNPTRAREAANSFLGPVIRLVKLDDCISAALDLSLIRL